MPRLNPGASTGPNPASRRVFGPTTHSPTACGSCIVCWPTKLTLVPDLADRVLSLMPPPEYPPPDQLDLPAAGLGQPPWKA